MNIDGELLTHLRFTDDIVLIAETTDQLQTMLTEHDSKSSAIGLRMNHMKTKYVRSANFPGGQMVVGGDEIEEVEKYVYLGQEVNMRRDMEKEISRRVRARWKAFNSIRDVLKGRLDKTTRANLFNGTVLPAMLYGSETWATMTREEQRLVTAQRAMQRPMSIIERAHQKRGDQREVRRERCHHGI